MSMRPFWIRGAPDVGVARACGVGLACVEADATWLQAPISAVVFSACPFGDVVEADEAARLVAVVVGGEGVVFVAAHAALHGAVFVVTRAFCLARLAVGDVAPEDAVVIFVVAVFVVYAANAFGGEVHQDVAVVGRELAAGVHAAGVLCCVVAKDAVFERRLCIIIKVYAAAFSGSRVVADAAVAVAGADAVAQAAAHRGAVAHDGAVFEIHMGSASC